MRQGHLEALKPVCPICREGRVLVSDVIRGDDQDVEQGLLRCENAPCGREYPVVDGIPILVRDPNTFVGAQHFGLLARDDLPEVLLRLIGDWAGPGSPLDSLRQGTSTYAAAHYGDLDVDGSIGAEAAIATILDRGLEHVARARRSVQGPIVDLGCSVGRGTFHLAARTATSGAPLVIGVDLDFTKLRFARRVLVNEEVRYARRRVGAVYDERCFRASFDERHRVDFWCADLMALPFAPKTFGFAASLNVLDYVASPLLHLTSLRDLVRPGSAALVTTPFDWSPATTAPEAWLGGHFAGETESERVVRLLLGGNHPMAIEDLQLVAEESGLAWPLRLNARSTLKYEVDLFVVARRS